MITKKFWRELDKICDYERDVPLKDKTTILIGGVTPAFIRPSDRAQFCRVIKLCKDSNVDYHILGAGSNVLFRDDGIKYVVIDSANLSKCYINRLGFVYAEAGIRLARLIQFCAKNGLSGLEYLIGIPASIGGAVTMNAGAFGVEIGKFVEYVDVWDGGKVIRLGKEKLFFQYRHSIFTNSKKYAIIGVGFWLNKDVTENILRRMQYTVQARLDTQRVGHASAGSVFKKTTDLAPAYMIEACGLKGATVGGAQVSQIHSGFIVNLGSATCQDVIKLIELVRNSVEEKFGVNLELEIIVI